MLAYVCTDFISDVSAQAQLLLSIARYIHACTNGTHLLLHLSVCINCLQLCLPKLQLNLIDVVENLFYLCKYGCM